MPGANFYYMDYKDQLVLTGELNEIGEAMASNVPDSYRTGIELMAGIKLDCGFNGTSMPHSARTVCRTLPRHFLKTRRPGRRHGSSKHGDTPSHSLPTSYEQPLRAIRSKGFEASLQSQYISKQYMSNAKQEECTLMLIS